jgi:alkanesulfonate monooxygenase SsuD/methylene tetrahydromethanopterin reductase-like flavin-dependent oxidoreductase (luciferase family)
MKFGIFFELSVPRPFTPEREREVIENALEQARLADELGFECAWVVEHHFLEEYSHSSAPELFLTAVAMQTQRIRVGHGAVVCVPEINHPIRVAERAAFLDLLSGGRLEFGTARSSTWTEIGGFEADPDDTKKDWDEYVRVLPKMWMQETFAHQGRCFSMPERAILPKPLQKPHPPMWVTVTSPGHRARRGRARTRLSRRRHRELCRAGAPHARVPPPHPALRAGRRGRERPRRDPQFPLLPRGREGRCRGRACASSARSAS